MAELTILRYPDLRLTRVARLVEAVDARIQALVADMLDTMYAANGIGLAATQVDVHERGGDRRFEERDQLPGADQPRDHLG